MGKKTENNASHNEADIPIIVDAEVVDVTLPPARNPNYKSETSVAIPSNFYTPQQREQLQEPYVHTNTSMVATANTNLGKPRLFTTLGRNATGLLCPYCHRQTITVARDYVGVGTVVAVFILALLFWPICWLPFCVPTCKRTHHYCGHAECQRKVGETSVCA